MKKSTKHRKPTAPGSADILSASPAPAPTIQGEPQIASHTDSISVYSEYSVVDPSASNQKPEIIHQKSEVPALSALTEDSIHENENPATDASTNNQSSIIHNQSAQSAQSAPP